MYYKLSGVCSFSWNFTKFQWGPDFVENVLGRGFNIEIVFLNFTFCGA